MLESKHCQKCDTTKPSTDFAADKTRKDGLQCYCKTCNQTYRDAHKKEQSAYDKKHYQENKSEITQTRIEYRATHKQQISEGMRRLHHENLAYRSRQIDLGHRRRIIVNKNTDEAVVAYIKSIYESESNVCYWCGKPISPDDLHIDHIIPLAQGGTHSIDNLAPSHGTCNISKGKKMPAEYIDYRLSRGLEVNEERIRMEG